MPLLPTDTPDAEDRFMRLDAAYIGARYHRSYRVPRGYLDRLQPDVERLLELTEADCKAHIAELARRDLRGGGPESLSNRDLQTCPLR